MNVSVGKLYDSVKGTEIKLLAGKQGLNKTVRWVHIAENEEICSFLKGEELILMTGVALGNNQELITLVKSAVEHKASGIIINLGPYIKDVSDEILNYCEIMKVPIFTVPWSTYMAELMRKFCLMITLEDKKELELSSAIKNAINFPNEGHIYTPYLESYGININDDYIVLLINIEKSKDMVFRQIENYAYNNKWPVITVEIDGEILMIFNEGYDEEKLINCYKELSENCTLITKENHICCGVGEKITGIKSIRKSYSQAKKVIDLKKANEYLDIGNSYNSLGIYRILLSIKDIEGMSNFVKDTLGNILKYDEINHSNLEKVLRMYLKNNGSVKETADKMFIHRNTVNYKINKINSLIGESLGNYEVCSKIIMALKIYDVLIIS